MSDDEPAPDRDTIEMSVIAGQAGRQAIVSAGSVSAALLAELVGSLHETGALSTESIVALAGRWHRILSEWPGPPEYCASHQVIAGDLAAEMAWRLPGIAPPAPAKPARVGRKRAVRRRPVDGG